MKLVRRILVAAILIALVVGATLLHPLLLAGLVVLWVFLASREFVRLLDQQGIKLPMLLLPLANLIFPISQVADPGRYFPNGQLPFLLIPLALVSVSILFTPAPRAPKLAYSFLGIAYLSLLPAHLIMLRYHVLFHPSLSLYVVLFPLAATWVNDTGAYAFGKWLGRHKLAPEISPNKTWEGFIVGVILTVGFSVVALRWVLPETGILAGVLLGLGLGVAAQVGDLVESVFKREAGAKDSSSALSEHGGFLDRSDSLLFTIPLFYYYLTAVQH